MAVKIGLSGKMRSGKSTVAERLQKHFESAGTSVCRMSLAADLKGLLNRAFGKENVSREILQAFGTDLIRKEGMKIVQPFMPPGLRFEDVWVKNCLYNVVLVEDKVGVVLIDDVRFPNEAYGLIQDGFVVARLCTTPALQLSREIEPGKETVRLEHESETALDHYEQGGSLFQFDVVCKPEASIDEIVEQILAVVNMRDWTNYGRRIDG